MQPEELLRSARARSFTLPPPKGGPEAALERLRQGCAHFFGRVPEPPVYLRREDPLREQAERLRDEGAELLAVGLAVVRMAGDDPQARQLLEALESYLTVLCFLADGRLAQAEAAWEEAGARERDALRGRRVWTRTDERRLPVYEPETGRSRYDPGEQAQLTVKLCCPTCRQADTFSFSAANSMHRLVCPRCNQPFLGFFGDVRSVGFTLEAGTRHYVVEVDELNGAVSRVQFEDASSAEFSLARRDFVAFVYTVERELKAVVNLSSGRILWLARSGPCFLATAAFGEGAPELAAFRRFRDEVLRCSAWGRQLERAYYDAGPHLARMVERHPRLRQGVRGGLGRVHRALLRWQGPEVWVERID